MERHQAQLSNKAIDITSSYDTAQIRLFQAILDLLFQLILVTGKCQ